MAASLVAGADRLVFNYQQQAKCIGGCIYECCAGPANVEDRFPAFSFLLQDTLSWFYYRGAGKATDEK